MTIAGVQQKYASSNSFFKANAGEYDFNSFEIKTAPEFLGCELMETCCHSKWLECHEYNQAMIPFYPRSN